MRTFNGITTPERVKSLSDWFDMIEDKSPEFIDNAVEIRSQKLTIEKEQLSKHLNEVRDEHIPSVEKLRKFLKSIMISSNRQTKPGDAIVKLTYNCTNAARCLFGHCDVKDYYNGDYFQIVTEKKNSKYITDKDQTIPYTHVNKCNYFIVTQQHIEQFKLLMAECATVKQNQWTKIKTLNEMSSEIWYEQNNVSGQNSGSKAMAAGIARWYSEWDGTGRSPSA